MLKQFDFINLVKAYSKIIIVILILIALIVLFTQVNVNVSLKNQEISLNSSSSVSSGSSSPSSSHPASAECAADADCNDGNQCTFDSCDEGKCIHNVNLFGECVMSNGKKAVCNEMGDCVKMETYCDNGIDDDGDGLIDCQDLDCEGVPCMSNGTVGLCQAGVCSTQQF